MSELIEAHQPCPDCGSSDALAIYDDHTYCFSCGKRSSDFNVKRNINKNNAEDGLTFSILDSRYRQEVREDNSNTLGKLKVNRQNTDSIYNIYNNYYNTLGTPKDNHRKTISLDLIDDNFDSTGQRLSNHGDPVRSLSSETDEVLYYQKEVGRESKVEHSVSSQRSGSLSTGVHEKSIGATTPPLNPAVASNLGQLEVSYRGISPQTRKTYGCLAVLDKDKTPSKLAYPYPNKAVHVRTINPKGFYWEGDVSSKPGLWATDVFPKGTAKAVTVTEGEEDAMSVYQMLGSKYPCVSVRSSGQGRKDCEADYEYLNSFDKIYLCLDNDDPGKHAAREIAVLFDPNKVHIVELGEDYKDANDYLKAGKEQEFVKCWWAAKKFIPRNIINGYDQIREVLSRSGATSLASYPFPTLQEMTYGVREGEVVLFTALEKVGKTEIMRAIEHHMLKTTDFNVGIIHLEEDEKRSVQGLLSYELDIPVHLPDSGVSLDDQLKAYEKLTTRDNRLHFYTHFGSDDPDNILGVIRYLVTVCGCKFIFLDHITMLATGYQNDDERRKLDYISTRLAMLTRELKFTLFLVSHVNDNGQTRGSRNISKIADLIVSLDRNPEAETFDGRNTTHLIVKGNRFAAKSGPAGALVFDPSTYKIRERTDNDVIQEEPF